MISAEETAEGVDQLMIRQEGTPVACRAQELDLERPLIPTSRRLPGSGKGPRRAALDQEGGARQDEGLAGRIGPIIPRGGEGVAVIGLAVGRDRKEQLKERGG